MGVEESILSQSDKLKSLEAYWRSKMIGDALPVWRDIDPWEMRNFLPHVFLIEITQNPLRFWFRLVGREVAQGYGKDMTGRYVDEIDLNDVQQDILDAYKLAVREARPVRSVCDYVKQDGRRLYYERLLLPLSADGKTIDMLLAGAVVLKAE